MPDDKPPPYDPDATCPKCGDGNVTCAHHTPGRTPLDMDQYRGECLDRTCTRCNFRWHEACIDAQPPKESSPETFDVDRALVKLREGKKVRRDCWLPGEYLRLQGPIVVDEHDVPWICDLSVAAGIDWLVVE